MPEPEVTNGVLLNHCFVPVPVDVVSSFREYLPVRTLAVALLMVAVSVEPVPAQLPMRLSSSPKGEAVCAQVNVADAIAIRQVSNSGLAALAR